MILPKNPCLLLSSFFSVFFSEDLSGFNILHDLRSRCSALGMGGKKREETLWSGCSKPTENRAVFYLLGLLFLSYNMLKVGYIERTFFSVAPYFSDVVIQYPQDCTRKCFMGTTEEARLKLTMWLQWACWDTCHYQVHCIPAFVLWEKDIGRTFIL